MRVLQLCHKPPFPQKDGGCIAMASITQALLDNHVDLRIVTASTDKHPWEKSAWPNELIQVTKHAWLDTEPSILGMLSSLITGSSYNITRFRSKELESIIKDQLLDFKPDVVWLESLFMTPYLNVIHNTSKAKVVLRSHNVEHQVWERLASNSNLIKKPVLGLLAKRLERYEVNMVRQLDAIAAISEEDNAKLSTMSDCEIKTIPIGMDLNKFTYKPPTQPFSMFHLGDMNWEPNKEAIGLFVSEVWPLVKVSSPNAKCVLAGRNMPQSISNYGEDNLKIIGDVPDANSFFSSHDILILPLLSGGGVRVKMLEAMAMGKAVVTTSIGAEGIGGNDGVHYILAENAREMADSIGHIYSGDIDIKAIGLAARKHIEAHFTNRAIGDEVNYFCRNLARLERP